MGHLLAQAKQFVRCHFLYKKQPQAIVYTMYWATRTRSRWTASLNPQNLCYDLLRARSCQYPSASNISTVERSSALCWKNSKSSKPASSNAARVKAVSKLRTKNFTPSR